MRKSSLWLGTLYSLESIQRDSREIESSEYSLSKTQTKLPYIARYRSNSSEHHIN